MVARVLDGEVVAAAVKDEDNIVRADELGLAMVFTGERHFLH
jgi:AICAR transformylase/IMP cyclohydrolase PurH